jgi:hypothetical protein
LAGVRDATTEARRLGSHVVAVQRHSGKTHMMHVWSRGADAGAVVAPSPLTWARIWEFGDSGIESHPPY